MDSIAVFSHLRRDAVEQRPRHMLSRLAARRSLLRLIEAGRMRARGEIRSSGRSANATALPLLPAAAPPPGGPGLSGGTWACVRALHHG